MERGDRGRTAGGQSEPELPTVSWLKLSDRGARMDLLYASVSRTVKWTAGLLGFRTYRLHSCRGLLVHRVQSKGIPYFAEEDIAQRGKGTGPKSHSKS